MVSNDMMFLKSTIKSGGYMKGSYGGGVTDTLIPRAFFS
jgi:hypothetical protein